MKPYNSIDVASYIVNKAVSMGLSINVTKTQKLLYIAYGLYLAVTDKRLCDEYAHAWPYGPVFPKTRKNLAKQDLYCVNVNPQTKLELDTNQEFQNVINTVFNTFGNITATGLSNWSHREGAPWAVTVSKHNFEWGDIIDDNNIRSYFKSILING